MCFLKSSAVLLLAAAFAAANPVSSGNYGERDAFGSFSNSYGAQKSRTASRLSGQSFNGGYDGNAVAASTGDCASDDKSSGASRLDGSAGVSGRGFNGVGFLSSAPGVFFAFPSLTSISYRRIPQRNNDLATLALLSALLANSSNNDNDDAADTTTRNTGKGQNSKVAFVPVVTVPAAAGQQKTTKIVKTTIETDGAVPSIPELNRNLDQIASEALSLNAEDEASASGSRSYSASGSSSRVY